LAFTKFEFAGWLPIIRGGEPDRRAIAVCGGHLSTTPAKARAAHSCGSGPSAITAC